MKDQDGAVYHQMAIAWASVQERFHEDPWGEEGPEGRKGKMAFMALYNVDGFRDFLFRSSFLKRYRVPHKILKRIRTSDRDLLMVSFDWVRYYLWGIQSKRIFLR